MKVAHLGHLVVLEQTTPSLTVGDRCETWDPSTAAFTIVTIMKQKSESEIEEKSES